MKKVILPAISTFGIYFSLLALPGFNSFSQDCFIRGSVKDDKTGQPLMGVNVVLDDTTGAVTDLNGKYEIKSRCGIHDLKFTFIGFEPVNQQVNVKAGEPYLMDISLREKITELDIVVVSAGKFEQRIEDVTVSMEVIKPALVENKNTYNIENIIDQVPGVSVMDGQCNIRNGSGWSYGAGSRVLVLVDDLPILTADASYAKWNFLPVENIDQIEVIKGASSALFGSSALNGVVNIRTAYPKGAAGEKGYGKINISHGFYFDPVRIHDSTGTIYDPAGRIYKPLKWWKNTQPVFTGTNFFYSKKIKNFDLVAGGNVFSDQGYRMGEHEQWVRANSNMRYRFEKINGLSAGMNVNVMKSKGGWFFLWENADSGGYKPMGGVDTPATTISYYTTNQTSYSPFIVYMDKKGNKFSLRNRYYQFENLTTTHQNSNAILYYSEFQYQRQKENNYTITFGATETYSNVVSELFGDHFGSNLSFYAQGDKKISRLSWSLGIRGEYFRIDTAETVSTFIIKTKSKTIRLPLQPVLRSGINYRLLEETYLRASYGQGYRFPSIAEKYISTFIGAAKAFPNPGLQPETGWSAEAGVKQGFKVSKWKGYLDIAGFWTEYQNMMEFVFDIYYPGWINQDSLINSPGPYLMSHGVPVNQLVDAIVDTIEKYAGFKSQNIGRSQIKGIECTLTGFGKIGFFNVLILGGYTFTEPVNFNKSHYYLRTLSDSNSTILKYRSKHMIRADIEIEYKSFSMGSSAKYNSFMQNIDKGFEEPRIMEGVKDYRTKNNKGDVLFDARFSCQISDRHKISLVCNNLFNREYMGRPGDIQSPRTLALQYILNF